MAQEADDPKKPALKPRVIGRYALFDEIAAGGMATVHIGRLVGPVGFSRTVAIKRLHPQFSKDPEFVSMFLDEARLASRIQHPNVVTTLDVVALEEEVFLVMEYVPGESLSKLVRNAKKAGERLPPGHAVSIMAGVLHGLHAAHEAKSERREPLNIVHRDVSPQNVLVGIDGVARVLDFGVAKAALRSQSTRDGQMKGKLSYMSPEQLNGKAADRRTDIFAAGVVFWEALCGERLFQGADAGEVFAKVLANEIPEPKSVIPELSDELNRAVMKALERDIDKRYQTAREFAIELESAAAITTARTVGEWVDKFAGAELEKRIQLVSEVESMSTELEELVRETSKPSRDSGRFTDSEASASGPRLRQKSVSGADADRNSSASAISEVSKPSQPSKPSEVSRNSQISSPSQVSRTSQVSNLSVPNSISSLHSVPVRRGAQLGPIVLAVAACLAGGALAFFVFRGATGGPSAAVPAPGQAQAASPESESAVAEIVDTTPTLQVEDLPAAESEVVGDAAAAAKPQGVPRVAVQPRQRPARTARPGPAAKAPEAKVNCTPPWFIDAKGMRRVKPECL